MCGHSWLPMPVTQVRERGGDYAKQKFFLLTARHFPFLIRYDVLVNQRKEGTRHENNEINIEHHLHDTICHYRTAVLRGWL